MKKKIAILLMVIFVLSMAATCYAANRWVYVSSSSDGASWYYDSQSLRTYSKANGEYIDTWVKVIPRNKAGYIKAHCYIHESSMQYLWTELLRYDEDNNLIEQKTFERVWSPIVPDSIMETVAKRLISVLH